MDRLDSPFLAINLQVDVVYTSTALLYYLFVIKLVPVKNGIRLLQKSLGN